MRIEGVEHIGIAVSDLDRSISHLEEIFGFKILQRQRIEERGVEIAMFDVGNTIIELVSPISEKSPISNFLSRRGNAIHHICFKVEGIEDWLKALQTKGVELIDAEPREGASGNKVAFINPKSTLGILVELCE